MPKQIQNNQFLGGSPLMDATPQPNSTNAVMSGGVYSALDNVGTEISELNSKLANIGTFAERDFNVLDTATWLTGGTYIITIQAIYTGVTDLAIGLYNFSEAKDIGMAEIINGSGRFSMTRLYKQEASGGEQVGLHKYSGTGNISYTMTVLKVS